MKKQTIFILFIILSIQARSQQIFQSVRGTVVDHVSQSPIPGAVVQLQGTLSPVFTDAQGKFFFAQVPVGKQSISVTYLGYKPAVLRNLSVNSGKELILNISLDEDIQQMSEVEVTARTDKNKSLNEMSTVSTRAFSVEETQKFAAAVNDPLRMALAFAGVVGGHDGNNHISIRGNSPNGLLWRMEGVEIPNPNHFANVGTSGGGVSILSAQLLNNSDFSTGAFAAEYGNALSGVFDLRLRKGNNQKREYTVQVGVLGVDLAAEGPFKKGYDGSYLINYRYSTLSILGKMGVPLGDAVTNFQDLSFNVFLPTRKFGNFSAFGFGGLSYQVTEAKKDSLLWQEDIFNRYDSRFHSNTGAAGITNTKLFNNQSYLKTALVFSGTQNGYREDRLGSDLETLRREYEQGYDQTKITLTSTYTRKISSASSIRAGFILNQLGYRLLQKDLNDSLVMEENINVKGQTHSAQAYLQLNHKFTPRLTGNVGLHYLRLLLNNSQSFEPRASLRFEATPKNILTAGYGLHSQLQPIGVYFAKRPLDGNLYTTPNQGLDLSKAHHFVLGFDRILNEFSHVKTEVYYQHLYDIPVSADQTSTFSMLNMLDGYNTESLVNKGLGRNYGAELTYERFLHMDLYYLLSASLYQSEYQAANGSWYNTRFNTNYATSFTAGKEWTIKRGGKDRVLGANIKSLYVGGFRYTPIDLPASVAQGKTVFEDDKTNEKQNPAYWRVDIRLSIKRNFEHVTSTFALDIQNTTNRKNVGGQYFDANTGEIKYWYQAPLLPILSYRLEF